MNRMILALDVYDEEKAIRIATSVSRYLWAIKVNWPLILGAGLNIIRKLKEATALPVIADLKLADIPNTNRLVASKVFEAGADYVIVHGFAGRESVRAVMEEGETILVVDMSHKGAEEFISRVTEELVRMANELRPFGVIAPATRPERIRYIKSRLSDGINILSPGVGAQGGSAAEALRAGADFIIVGRSIYSSRDPIKSAKSLWKVVREWS